MEDSKQPAAVFDFDGTVTRSESLVPILHGLLRRHPGGLAELPRILALLGPYLAGWIPKERMKDQILRIFARVEPARLAELMEHFEQTALRPLYLPGALERIEWHRAQGHRLVLASVSLEFTLRPSARRLGFDTLIATRACLEGVWRVLGANCYGREKVARLLAEPWYSQVDWPASWAYSDHVSDLPLLMLCGHPVASGPSRALRQHAQDLGWPIVDWR